MKSKIICIFLALSIAFSTLGQIVPVSAAGSETIRFTVNYRQTEARKMAEKLNEYRESNGKNALTYDYNLEKVAMQRAAEIAVRFKTDDEDTDIRPDGMTFKQTLADFGFDISPRNILYGENILFGTQDSMELDSAFTMLCTTEENRVEMLGYYSLVGIGHIKIEEKTDFWVQVFANKGTAGDYTAPIDGNMQVSVKIDPSIVSAVNVEYASGDHTVAAGNTVQVPTYIPKIKVVGCELEKELELSPLYFESDDGYVRASNGMMTGLKEGTGNISVSFLGRNFSYGVTVTPGNGNYVTSTPTQTVTQTPTVAPTPTVTNVPTQKVTSIPTAAPTQAVTTTVPTQTVTQVPTQIVTTAPTQTPTQSVTATPKPTATPAASVKKGDTFSEGNLKYKVTGINTVEVIGLTSKSITSVTIPATVKYSNVKFKITKIAAGAFKSKTKLKTVEIGKNVKTIGKNAFYGCSKLNSVTFIGTSVKSIGKKAFTKINSKAVINVPSKSYKSYKKLLEGSGCTATIKK